MKKMKSYPQKLKYYIYIETCIVIHRDLYENQNARELLSKIIIKILFSI